MRVIIYIRVSTPGQALEEKYSLRAQKEELTNYAKKMDWAITDIIQDVDKGGDFAKEGLKNLMELADKGKTDVVLVYDQSRLSRLDGIHWEMLKAVLKQNNVRLAEPGRMIDLNDDVQEMFSDLQNWFSRSAKKDIVKTMMRGKRQMLREGKPWGVVPFEYVYDKKTKTMSKNESYTWVIPKIDELYLKEQLGLVAIAHKLNEIMPNPKGRRWNERLVFDRIRNKAYHGIMEKKFSNGEIISAENIYPPMRTKETYLQLQEEIKRRHHTAVKKSDGGHMYMLRNTYITCAYCGRKIGYANHGKKNKPKYYLKHGRKIRLSTKEVCDISINSVRLDNNLINAIKDILSNEEKAKEYIKLDVEEKDIIETKDSVNAAKKQVTNVQSKLDRLVDLYLDGTFDKNELDTKKELLNKEKDAAINYYEELQSKLNLLENKKWNYEVISNYFDVALDFDKKLTDLELTQMIGNLFPEGILHEEKLILVAKLDNGAPLEIKIPIDQNLYIDRYNKVKKTSNL